MRSLNPGFKFLTLLIASLILSLTYNVRLNLAVFAVCLVVTVATPGVNRKRLAMMLIPFLIAAAGMFITGFLFSSEAGAMSANLAAETRPLYVTSWDSAFKLSSRILAYGGVGMLFAFTTVSMDFIMSLMQQFKLPPKFAYGILAAYHFFPVVASEYAIVRSALAVRGVKVWPLSRKRMFPMLVHALERSESIAMAMESRGFDNDAPRSVAFRIPLRAADFVFLFGVTAALLLGVFFL